MLVGWININAFKGEERDDVALSAVPTSASYLFIAWEEMGP